MKGEIQLMGSAVSLLSHSETGQFFTFGVVSGITAMVMQAKTVDEMMDWASTLYHASSIANGGGYLIEAFFHCPIFAASPNPQRHRRRHSLNFFLPLPPRATLTGREEAPVGVGRGRGARGGPEAG